MRRGLMVLVLLAATLGLSGCAAFVAHMIADAPNKAFDFSTSKEGRFIRDVADPYFTETTFVPVGPPPAKLSIAIMPPGDYGVSVKPKNKGTSTTQCTQTDLRGPVMTMPAGFKLHADGALPSDFYAHYAAAVQAFPHPAPKATIILLHGFGLNKYAMFPWALILGEAGYRTVLVDLRGHGQSTGEWTTYGILESADLSQVINYLQLHGLIAGKLAVLGNSLGAAIAVDAAAADPRIKAVVAIEPFARATSIIANYAQIGFPVLSFFIPHSSLIAGEAEAGELAHVDLKKAAPIDIVHAINAPILFVYGSKDHVTSAGTPRAFEQAARNAKLIVLPGLDHFAVPAHLDITAPPVLRWLHAQLGGGIPTLAPAVQQKTKDGAGSKQPAHFGIDFSMCISA